MGRLLTQAHSLREQGLPLPSNESGIFWISRGSGSIQ
jgi:hypothetical protein